MAEHKFKVGDKVTILVYGIRFGQRLISNDRVIFGKIKAILADGRYLVRENWSSDKFIVPEDKLAKR